MTTVLVALLLSLAQDTPLTIRFIGNESFEISDGKTTLLTDYPYRPGAFGYMMYDPKSIRPRGNVILLITHEHLDHFDATQQRDTSWKIIAPRSVTRSLTGALAIPLDSLITIHGLTIRPILTNHGPIEHHSYLVRWGRLRLYLSGDTDEPTELLDQENLDYAFVSPWLYSTIVKSGRAIPAHRVIIYHHRKDEQIPNCRGCWIPKQGESITTVGNE